MASGVRSVVSRRGPESLPFHSGPPPVLFCAVPSVGLVTALREHPRRAGRHVVEIDGVPVGPVSAEVVGELGIRMGCAVDDAMIARLMAAARAVACYDRALDALARRSRSRVDLGRWLRARDYRAVEIEPTLDRLTALGLLDDLAFARGYAHARTVGRGYGVRRVAAELAHQGVARPIVDEVLRELREVAGGSEGYDEHDALVAAAEKRFRSLQKSGLDPRVAQRRLFAWLVRRGFAPGDSAQVSRRLTARLRSNEAWCLPD